MLGNVKKQETLEEGSNINVSSTRSKVFDGDSVSCKLQALPATSLIETLPNHPDCGLNCPTVHSGARADLREKTSAKPITTHTASHFPFMSAFLQRNVDIHLVEIICLDIKICQ